MAAIATAWVDVKVNRGPFEAEIKTLGKSAAAGTAGTQVGTTIGKKGAQGVKAGFGGVIPGMVKTFAVLGAIHVFKGFIDDARDSARVGRQTEAVIRSTGGAAHITAAGVESLAKALSNSTGKDDEAIKAGENMLLTFTRIRNEQGKGNDVFNQTSRTVLDMTAAMNGGVVTQENMAKTAILVGKAVNDPIKGITALQRVGVTFTQGQRDSIKAMVDSGNIMGAQKVILRELATEFGGAAKASSDPMERLSVVVKNLGESVGTLLLPTIGAAATGLAKLADAAAAHPTAFKVIATGVAALAAAVLVLNTAAKVGTAVQTAWATTTGLATRALGAQAAAVTADTAAVDGLTTSTVAADGAQVGLMGKVGRLAGALGALGAAYEVVVHRQQIRSWIAWGDLLPNQTEGTHKLWGELGTLDEKFNRVVGQFTGYKSTADKATEATFGLSASAQAAADGIHGADSATTLYNASVQAQLDGLHGTSAGLLGYAGATRTATVATQAQTAAEIKAAAAVSAKGNALLQTRGDQSAYEAAVDSATAALKANGKTLDVHTEKGRANRQALDAIASTTLNWRDQMIATGHSQAEQTALMEKGRAKYIATAVAMGDTESHARQLAQAIFSIPASKGSRITINTTEAKRQIAAINAGIDAIHDKIAYVRIRTISGSTAPGAGHATGGPVGVGRGSRDDQLALLTRGEHVWTTREVAAAGGHSRVAALRSAALAGVLRRAGGGPVPAVATTAGTVYTPSAMADAMVAAMVSAGIGSVTVRVDGQELQRVIKVENNRAARELATGRR